MKLEVKDAAFSYDEERTIFSGLDLELDKGQVMAVLGPNGSGKTTFLRCVMGMLYFTQGSCRLNGQETRTMPAREFWRLVSYVPQQRSAQQNAYTVLESIPLGRSGGMKMFARPGAADVEAAERVMEELKISHLQNRECRTLSGGEFQMALIGRALVSEPQLLILDEPESGLDFKNQLIVLNTIETLSKRGIACIFNTHYPEHAVNNADLALMMGREVPVFGRAKDVVNEENIEASFGVKVAVTEREREGRKLTSVIPLVVK
ncbi:MAG: ABC transporter ATP-binding protein [Lachnospiraceae bacterium]|nr:ABC transporter ATP-binding protein [Lachnospiraceae bacterium]